MKRYWLSIMLVPFIVVCLGAYYIYADGQYPEFYLQRLEGNAQEEHAVLLKGQYGEGLYHESVTIGSQGSEYDSERSFLSQLSPIWGPGELKRLAAEHRQFMRGKRSALSFYEDESRLIFVDVKSKSSDRGLIDPRFVVSVLDIKTDRTSSYEFPIPNSERFVGINVRDVQYVKNQLKIVTLNSHIVKPSGQIEIHLYTADLANGTSLADSILLGGVNASNTNIYVSNEDSVLKPHPYVAFRSIQYHVVKNDTGSFKTDVAKEQLYVFQTENGEAVKIDSKQINDLLAGVSTKNHLAISIQGEDLFLAETTGDGIRLIRYHIPDAQTEVHDLQTGPVQSFIIKNGRLYVMEKTNKYPAEVYIADARSGKLLYKGTVIGNDGTNLLRVYGLSVK